MKIIALFLLFTNIGFAASTQCELTEGFYRNSPNNLRNLRLSTVVDIFTLNNAKTLYLNLDGEDIRFPHRTKFKSGKRTEMVFRTTEKGKGRAVHVLIDRSPRLALKNKEFIGNIVITPEMENPEDLMLMVQCQEALTYNFSCKF